MIEDQDSGITIDKCATLFNTFMFVAGLVNLFMGIFFNTETKYLWVMAACMQQLTFSSLTSVHYPAITHIFYSNCNFFARMDQLGTISYMKAEFNFKQSDGFSPKYEQFGWQSRNFLINSASWVFILPAVFIVGIYVKRVNHLAV